MYHAKSQLKILLTYGRSDRHEVGNSDLGLKIHLRNALLLTIRNTKEEIGF